MSVTATFIQKRIKISIIFRNFLLNTRNWKSCVSVLHVPQFQKSEFRLFNFKRILRLAVEFVKIYSTKIILIIRSFLSVHALQIHWPKIVFMFSGIYIARTHDIFCDGILNHPPLCKFSKYQKIFTHILTVRRCFVWNEGFVYTFSWLNSLKNWHKKKSSISFLVFNYYTLQKPFEFIIEYVFTKYCNQIKCFLLIKYKK